MWSRVWNRQMRRRDFIKTIGGTAAVWPIAARAQQSTRVPTVGVLGASTPSDMSQWIAAFARRLHELGWVEGRTVAIEYRWAEGRSERMAEIVAEFVRVKVDLIVVSGTPAIILAKKVTSIIPIVFAGAADPVGSGLVASLARPGGNTTGLSNQFPDLAAKKVDLLRETVPDLRRLSVMGNVGSPGVTLEMSEVQEAGRTLGIDVIPSEIRRKEDFALAFRAIRGRVDALYVCSDPFVATNRTRVNTMALSDRLPTMHGLRETVEAGGLMSYGPNFSDLWRRAADYADKILRGAKPADLPVEQPTKFDLIINLITAEALGVTIPPTLLARANEVIE